MAPKDSMLRSLSALSRTLVSPSSAARFLPRPSTGRSLHQNRLVVPSEGLALPTGNRLIERLRSLTPERLHLESLVSADDARKVLRASKVVAVRDHLKELPQGSIPYREFLRICGGDRNKEEGVGIAKTLDEAGDVIVLGDIVLLHPDQVTRAVQGAILNSTMRMTVRRKEEEEELRKMEKAKAEMDAKAAAGARKELWTGLGLLAVQTLGFMRLTFWELSWDVMEPVCFYVTSLYFMLGYAFFLRTSRDPSFEGIFQTRFEARQRRLFEASSFDLGRFHHLRRIVHGSMNPQPRTAMTTAGHHKGASLIHPVHAT